MTITQQQQFDAENRGTRYVEISRPFIEFLTADWSSPVEVKINGQDGDVLLLEFREVVRAS